MIITTDKDIETRGNIEVARQWFHTIYAIVNTNRPTLTANQRETADKIQDLAWHMYCHLGDLARAHEETL